MRKLSRWWVLLWAPVALGGPGCDLFLERFVQPAQIFFSIYFVLTGLHALHMIIGLGLMTWMFIWTKNGVISVWV